MNIPQIAPSILTADFLKLGEVIEMINSSEADMIHLDVMDGNFVPNLSFGLPVISQIKSIAKKTLDAHLMIVNPDSFLEQYRDAGVDNLTVHYETCPHLHRTIQRIKDLGMTASVSLNPHTPVHLLSEIIADLDMVLIMSVNPGFGGQKFIKHSFEKVERLKKMIDDKGLNTKIQIDGGVNLQNIKPLCKVGVDVFVVGNTIFSAPDPIQMIRQLKETD